ncbi:MAG: hypothetical protein NTW86_17865 [Candidatus Sumerlaeota bacterium]|nr:hypothetical protein [Candidatus Sumerlaeota bacterium]
MAPEAAEERLLALARKAREAILPWIDERASGAIRGQAASGDVTYQIDMVAEEVLARETPALFPGAALFTEDEGLRTFDAWNGQTLVADPIDGSRPTIGGLECSCVSLALAEGGEAATFADVVAAVLVEIRTGKAYAAGRGAGARRLSERGEPLPVILSRNENLSTLFWSFEYCARPVQPLSLVYSELINGSSHKGSCFMWAACTFSIARLLGGQIDAYVDIWQRLARDFPRLGDWSRRMFGKVGGLMPYDMAAAWRIAVEAGCSITDERGRALDGKPLLSHRQEDVFGCVAASNAPLHAQLMECLERGVRDRAASLSHNTPWTREAW